MNKDYRPSLTVEAWYSNGVRYRRVIAVDGRTIIEKADGGRYVPDYKQGLSDTSNNEEQNVE